MPKSKTPSGTIAIAAGYLPQLGQPLAFDYTISDIGNQNPRIEIDAWQTVPFDYVDSNGASYTQTDPLVYAEARDAGGNGVNVQPFSPLGGFSVWSMHGGSAHCRATLYYWDNHPSQHQVVLATIEFDVVG